MKNTETSSPLWRLFPHFIVRTTGFSYELVERLRAPEMLALARQICQAQAQLQELRAVAPRFHHPDRKLQACFRSGRPLPEDLAGDREWIGRWNNVATLLARLEQEYSETCQREATRLHSTLLDMLAEPRFQEAVVSTNPGAYRDILRANGKLGRRLERQAIAYVQRLSTKNETVSFFGPINYGRCAPDSQPPGVVIAWQGPSVLDARQAHPASWLIRGLIDHIAFSPGVAPWLILQPRTFAQHQFTRNTPLKRLLEAIDGFTPLGHVCKSLDLSLDAGVTLTREACRVRFITHQLEVPAAEEAPLENLIYRLAALPTDATAAHIENLKALLALMHAFSCADAAEKLHVFAELRHLISTCYQIEGPVAAPQFYGDRQPVREECLGTLDLEIAGPRADELETRVQPILELLAGAAVRTHQAVNTTIATLLGQRTLPLMQALVECADLPIPFDTTLTDAIAAAIPDSRLKEFHLDDLVLPTSDAESSTVCSVDLMIGAKNPAAWARGDYEIVLSDVHDTALVWGWALQFHRERARLQAEMSMLLSQIGGRLPVITMLASRRTGLPPAEFPGPLVEFGGLSANARPWLLPVDDLRVESDGQTARLCSHKLNSEVRLWNGELESLFHTAFSLPRIRPLGLSLGMHTPRLLYRGVVVQREQWRLETGVFSGLVKASSLPERMLLAAEIWGRYGLPERLFAKFPAERKPFYLDVASPQLLALLETKCQENPTVVFSEMRPQPDMLWLQSAVGSHTAELRCTYIRRRNEL